MFVIGLIGLITIALAFMAYKIIKTKSFSFLTIVILIILILSLCFVGYVVYGLFYTFEYLPRQGKLLNVMPDTSWIKSNLKVFYSKDDSLYSIDINGKNKKKICDRVRVYNLSPNWTKVVVWNLVKRGKTSDKDLSDISIIDLTSGKIDIVEESINCNPPLWFPGALKIVYRFDDDYNFCIFNVKDGTKKVINVPKMVSQLHVTVDGKRLVYLALFSKKYYQYDIASGDITEMQKFRNNPKTAEMYNYIDDKDIYWGPTSRGPESLDGETKAYSRGGSLWFKSSGQDELVVEYKGKFDSKLAPGIKPEVLSRDARFVVFRFKGNIYICDILSKKSGYLAEGDSPQLFGS